MEIFSLDDFSVSAALLGLTVVGTSMAIVWFTVKRNQMAQKAETSPFPGLPTAPGAHWLLGHLPRMEQPNGFLGSKYVFQDYADKTTGLCAVWAANKRALSVLSGNDAKTILKASRTKASHSYVTLHFQKFLGKKNMVTLQGKEWKLYRTAVHKSFTPAMMEQSQNIITTVGKTLAESLLKEIHQKQEEKHTSNMKREIHPLMKMATADVFFATMLGVDLQACSHLELPTMATSFEFLASEFSRRIRSPLDITASQYYLPTKANQKHAEHHRAIQSYIMDQLLTQQKQTSSSNDKDFLENNQNKNNNLLYHIWKAAESEAATVGETVDMEAVCDVAMTLFFAGYDTTSITLAYAIYLLVKHPEIYRNCLEEIDAVLGGTEKDFTGPEQLPYTQAVIYETLRLYPPATLVARALEKDMELHGHTFPKGTSCYVPIWLIQRHEMNFPRPLEMRPDRWVRWQQAPTDNESNATSSTRKSKWEERPPDDDDNLATDIAPANQDAFVAFSLGARNCAGRSLAIRESVTILSCLLHKLQFELVDPSYQVHSIVKLLNQPDDGLPMIIKARR
ncbi:Leukotriene-B(4) omega-hydroxylase 2 [Seminavis robusta]|uniref:Leukotriene-B(4) omega-hydroxylase 2 n=1 Tax=Seminavis robusta TaxID=568900 RepID=A0A9N8E1X3_9STRA|nr:Leukotriene-B(4) omega-hydroxylase 2 [Seminavis robusta]|eukprot:Sro448_g145120.1 Leukotriene-B(4) omega-hydroxylase 2 (565) ;mRNA; f:23802-25496